MDYIFFFWISAYVRVSARFYCPTFHKLKALPYITELIQFIENHNEADDTKRFCSARPPVPDPQKRQIQ